MTESGVRSSWAAMFRKRLLVRLSSLASSSRRTLRRRRAASSANELNPSASRSSKGGSRRRLRSSNAITLPCRMSGRDIVWRSARSGSASLTRQRVEPEGLADDRMRSPAGQARDGLLAEDRGAARVTAPDLRRDAGEVDAAFDHHSVRLDAQKCRAVGVDRLRRTFDELLDERLGVNLVGELHRKLEPGPELLRHQVRLPGGPRARLAPSWRRGRAARPGSPGREGRRGCGRSTNWR